VRLARPLASTEEVRGAAERLGVWDLVRELPRGLDTDVGEKGANLSLGQRQVVCFLRALLAEPELLILDEATSAVDSRTEARLQQALARLLAGRTAFIVAHRLSTIKHADLVLVVDQGRIVEQGRHDELIAAGGYYAGLYGTFARSSAARGE
jgi:ATP-binding cassette subfamily B protein